MAGMITLEQVLARSMRGATRSRVAPSIWDRVIGQAGAVGPKMHRPRSDLPLSPGLSKLETGPLPPALHCFGFSDKHLVRNSLDLTLLLRSASAIGDWQVCLAAARDSYNANMPLTEQQVGILVHACQQAEKLDELQDVLLGGFPAASSPHSEASPHSESAPPQQTPPPTAPTSLGPSVMIAVALMDALAKRGLPEAALQIFNRIPSTARTVDLYNSAILACEHGMLWEKALSIYRSMQHPVAAASPGPSVEIGGTTEREQEGSEEEKKPEASPSSGPTPNAVTYAAIISVLEQCGRSAEAATVLEETPPATKEIIMSSYAAFIHVWAARHGNRGLRRF